MLEPELKESKVVAGTTSRQIHEAGYSTLLLFVGKENVHVQRTVVGMMSWEFLVFVLRWSDIVDRYGELFVMAAVYIYRPRHSTNLSISVGGFHPTQHSSRRRELLCREVIIFKLFAYCRNYDFLYAHG